MIQQPNPLLFTYSSEYPRFKVQGLNKSHPAIFVTHSATFDQQFHTSSQVTEMMYQFQIIYEVANVGVYGYRHL